MKNLINKTFPMLLMISLLVLPSLVFAQPGFGDDVPDVPIDGGLSVLLAAGAVYGIKKIRDRKKNLDSSSNKRIN